MRGIYSGQKERRWVRKLKHASEQDGEIASLQGKASISNVSLRDCLAKAIISNGYVSPPGLFFIAVLFNSYRK